MSIAVSPTGAIVDSPLMADLLPAEQAELLVYLEEIQVEEGTEIVHEGEPSDALFVVIEGQARIQRGTLALSVVQPGDCFGEMGLFTNQPRAGSVRAMTPMTLACIRRERLNALADANPDLTFKLYRNVAGLLRKLLTDMTDLVSELLQERARPQRTEVEVTFGGERRFLRPGTPLSQVLPERVDGRLVVAGLVERRPTTLSTPLYASTEIAPLFADHWEGREVVRHSVGLLLLEAAGELEPAPAIRVGPSLGFAHLVQVEDKRGWENGALAKALEEQVRSLIRRRVDFRRERWTVEEARAQFIEQGWADAARLLRTWRDASVPMVSCGSLYAIEVGPTLPSSALVDATKVELVPHNGDILLYFGDYPRQSDALVRAADPGALAREHEQWLNALGLSSVGAFNDMCIGGNVGQIIRVSEGFHEKRISQIADEFANRDKALRVICVSGPSSSGKTTFIKRLTVQLQVNGLNPKELSLDNFYVDRESTVRDASGEFDFEAFEALDQSMLEEQLERLLRGEPVVTAHYNFREGKSYINGGPTLELGPHDVLLVEGIHALNPRLPIDESHGVFRVFINPASSLPLDHVTRVSVSDIRLLRRIVRDRRKRGITAVDNILRWPSVRRGERRHIFPYQDRADAVFNTSLIYEPSVLKVYAERYLLEVPRSHEAYTTAHRLRSLIDHFVSIYPDHVPPTSLLREFIG